MKQTLIDLFTSKKFLAAATAIIVYVAGRFGFNVDPTTLDHIWQALLVYVGAQGVADLGKSAALVKAAAPANDNAPSSSSTAASSATAATVKLGGAAAAVLVMLAIGGAALPACSSARQHGATAVGAFLDCEAANLTPLLPDAVSLAKAAILRWISGSGTVDASGLKSDAAPLKTDLARCAFDAAVAALAASAAPITPGAPAAAALTIDGGALRSRWAVARAELGWPTGRPQGSP